MSFREIPIRSFYSTANKENLSEIFYIPFLEEAKQYDRVSGYFSSKALASYSKGIEGLLKNDGLMRLIISEEISEEDFKLIKEGYDLKEKLSKQLIDRLTLELTVEEKLNFFNLAHMIALGKVEIRIGFVSTGIFHSKFGIMRDLNDNIIYFTGSNNETGAAIESNYESFGVTTTWLSSDFDQQKIYDGQVEFNDLWTDGFNASGIFVKEINEELMRYIKKFDRGRLILNKEMLIEDALILARVNNQLSLTNNLTTYSIKAEDLAIKKLNVFCIEHLVLKPNLNYKEIQKVIVILEKYSLRKKFTFIVTNELLEYLEQSEYWIEERFKYANLLKAQNEKAKRKFLSFADIVNEQLERELRPQQMWSSFYMAEMKRAANFSVPGAGKTSMVYGVYAYLNHHSQNLVNQIVMIGPKNSFLSWKLEFIENFGSKKRLNVLDIHEETAPDFQLQVNAMNFNLILVNYESLQKYEKILYEIIGPKTMLIFDEVHKIKGIESKRAQVAKKIAENAQYKYVLTGTPIPNTYQDIFNFLNLLYTSEYKEFFNFKSNELKNPDQIKIDEINDKLYPLYWRTTKGDLNVPAPDEDYIYKIQTTVNEQHLIDMLYEKYRGNAFLLYTRLIQASTNPGLLLKSIDYYDLFDQEEYGQWKDHLIEATSTFSKNERKLIESIGKTSKYKSAISKALELSEEGKQIIIWCIFVDTINQLENDLSVQGLNVKVIYGSTSQEERTKIITDFKENKVDILITNPHTLAESVSLHHTCHDAIYLEYSFNLTHMLQSRDRIHRLGLRDDDYTRYYYFMLEGQHEKFNSIDEKIYLRLKDKEARMIGAIERGTLEPDPTVDYDEILDLFK